MRGTQSKVEALKLGLIFAYLKMTGIVNPFRPELGLARRAVSVLMFMVRAIIRMLAALPLNLLVTVIVLRRATRT